MKGLVKGSKKDIKILCTLGPSSLNEDVIYRLDKIGIDLFRINLSHTKLDQLEAVISKIRSCTNKPICLDTEGAQVRIGYVEADRLYLEESSVIRITNNNIVGGKREISLNPSFIIKQIMPSDLISIDFDSVLLRVIKCDVNSIMAKVVCAGYVGSNKAVTIDRKLKLPVVSEKDKAAIKVGLKNGIKYFALSFASSKEDIRYFRKLAGKNSHIISKIESKTGIENIDGIIEMSDSILIDRGDLSREEPIEKIPFLQKLIIKKANDKKIPVYIATNLLESMVKSKNPTRAEVNDIVSTLLDGADGLVLAAETAIGMYPVNCATMIRKTINQFLTFSSKTSLIDLQQHDSFMLVEPHGGRLINRTTSSLNAGKIDKYKKLTVDINTLLDVEQIAIGTFSPLEGFMTKKELSSVLTDIRLPNGLVWPLPIALQVKEEEYARLKKETDIALSSEGVIYAILHLDDAYRYNLDEISLKVFGTTSAKHPGVMLLKSKGGYFLAGKIDLINRLPSGSKQFEITPKQSRAIFENKGWSRVIGFHTRNVAHRIHEHIQMQALKEYHCDGIFIHPVVGPKKRGDYTGDIILRTYEMIIDKFYPKGKVLLGGFGTYSRYAGPREALFTALCRKNFGCSHFIIGRDHTGVGDYYKPYDSHKIFDLFSDLGITPIFFNEINYCKRCGSYVDGCGHGDRDILRISGQEGRHILSANQLPPDWFIRREISELVLESARKGEKVFVK